MPARRKIVEPLGRDRDACCLAVDDGVERAAERDVRAAPCAIPSRTGTPASSTNDGTLRKLTLVTRVRPSARLTCAPSAESSPAGAVEHDARSRRRGTISPCSSASVTTAITPWPHIVL